MDEATIGARLRTLRRWRGKTQTELAGLAGLSPSFISMVETGNRPLDRRSHIAALASALQVSETDLVGGPHLSADRQAQSLSVIRAQRHRLSGTGSAAQAQRRRVVSCSICDSFSGLRTAYSPVMRPSSMRTAMTVSISPSTRRISDG